jgi:hypothetical protein
LPNDRDVGLAVGGEFEMLLPVSVSVCWKPALSVRVRVAVRGPIADGVNSTTKLQFMGRPKNREYRLVEFALPTKID